MVSTTLAEIFMKAGLLSMPTTWLKYLESDGNKGPSAQPKSMTLALRKLSEVILSASSKCLILRRDAIPGCK
jgi:hypothetical protein